MLLGALAATAQDDLKRVLAWSTVSQLGRPPRRTGRRRRHGRSRRPVPPVPAYPGPGLTGRSPGAPWRRSWFFAGRSSPISPVQMDDGPA
ncbi:proton-conducting transporter membrane subunit [Micromonospora humida]